MVVVRRVALNFLRKATKVLGLKATQKHAPRSPLSEASSTYIYTGQIWYLPERKSADDEDRHYCGEI